MPDADLTIEQFCQFVEIYVAHKTALDVLHAPISGKVAFLKSLVKENSPASKLLFELTDQFREESVVERIVERLAYGK